MIRFVAGTKYYRAKKGRHTFNKGSAVIYKNKNTADAAAKILNKNILNNHWVSSKE